MENSITSNLLAVGGYDLSTIRDFKYVASFERRLQGGAVTGVWEIKRLFFRELSRNVFSVHSNITFDRFTVNPVTKYTTSTVLKYYPGVNDRQLLQSFCQVFSKRLSEDWDYKELGTPIDDVYPGGFIFDSITFVRLINKYYQVEDIPPNLYRCIVYIPKHPRLNQACSICLGAATNVLDETADYILTGYDLGEPVGDTIRFPTKMTSPENYKMCVWSRNHRGDFKFIEQFSDYDVVQHTDVMFNHPHAHVFRTDVRLRVSSTDEIMKPLDVSICDVLLNTYSNIIKSNKNGRGIFTWQCSNLLHDIPMPLDVTLASMTHPTYLLMLIALLHDGTLMKDLVPPFSDRLNPFVEVEARKFVRKGKDEYFMKTQIDKEKYWRLFPLAAKKFKMYAITKFLSNSLRNNVLPLSDVLFSVTVQTTDELGKVECKILRTASSYKSLTQLENSEAQKLGKPMRGNLILRLECERKEFSKIVTIVNMSGKVHPSLYMFTHSLPHYVILDDIIWFEFTDVKLGNLRIIMKVLGVHFGVDFSTDSFDEKQTFTYSWCHDPSAEQITMYHLEFQEQLSY